MLHDVGKAVDHEMEGSHIQLGVDLCRKYKESAAIINAVEAHHGDVEAQTLVACIVQAADAITKSTEKHILLTHCPQKQKWAAPTTHL